MHYIVWALRLVVFILVVLLAVKNTDPVVLKFFGEHQSPEVPLVVVVLGSFVLGMLYMYFLNLPARFARKREIIRLTGEVNLLERNLQQAKQAQAIAETNAVVVATPPDGFVPTKQ